MSSSQQPPPAPPHDPTGPRADASAGLRVGALGLDTLLVMVPLFVVSALLFGQSRARDGAVSLSLSGLPFLLTVLVAAVYFFACELAWGQTLGKKLVGIRVVSEKGPQRTAGQVLVRTLLRVVDGFGFYLVAFVAVLASAKNQRIGDMAASTRVVRAR
ncbi:hypothetical protein ENKNEFLB_00349 [Nocardioides aquaticus]|jgi:uncharacterized RDD family membrane protein YckC|uniref:RDD domain-containing protein n=1 Tax=Nocardioides aquaticus TaxID=160826 RepID=A0ABX8EDQ6_9ACTN|nr:RDD family protein [Nocardioides aquaticus]QVT77980.1 hypothetical protein ENKNEFLB_00349 [Nocardioides aquaticus]